MAILATELEDEGPSHACDCYYACSKASKHREHSYLHLLPDSGPNFSCEHWVMYGLGERSSAAKRRTDAGISGGIVR